MRRLHFYIMGLIALAFGLVAMAEYVMVSYGLRMGWLDAYPPEQLQWLAGVPAWLHGVWGAQATLALVGALCLLAHVQSSVWMLFFAFLAWAVMAIWAAAFAEPTIFEMTGDASTTWIFLGLTTLLTLLIYLYARGEKRTGDVL